MSQTYVITSVDCENPFANKELCTVCHRTPEKIILHRLDEECAQSHILNRRTMPMSRQSMISPINDWLIAQALGDSDIVEM